MTTEIDPTQFRHVLSHYPTGVVVVTAMSATGQPLGMTVGTFTSVSLDPPLVAFLPDRRSRSWNALREAGPTFCVNVLCADQEAVSHAVATRPVDKFADIAWQLSPGGNPAIEGSAAIIDCTVQDIHDAGDHHIVVGRVDHLEARTAASPLLFLRGGFGSFHPAERRARAVG